MANALKRNSGGDAFCTHHNDDMLISGGRVKVGPDVATAAVSLVRHSEADTNTRLPVHGSFLQKAKTESMIADTTPTASNAILYVLVPAALASSAATTAGLTFLPSFHRIRGGGARLRRPSRERTRTTAKNMKPE